MCVLPISSGTRKTFWRNVLNHRFLKLSGLRELLAGVESLTSHAIPGFRVNRANTAVFVAALVY